MLFQCPRHVPGTLRFEDVGHGPCILQVLEHPWLQEQGAAPERPLEPVVLQRMNRFAAMNKLKRVAVLVMARCLSPADLSGLQRLFASIDTDGSGSISVSELRAALEGFGTRIPEADLLVRTPPVTQIGVLNNARRAVTDPPASNFNLGPCVVSP